MNDTRYTIYWFDQALGTPMMTTVWTLTDALKTMESLRNQPEAKHVAMCSENANSVGKPGVDCVKDGKTPDGVEYTWVKRRDGGQ